MLTLIYDFNELDKITSKISDEEVVMYLYLSWLGLSHDKIILAETYDYNFKMRILHTDGRTLYIKDDKIANALKKACESGHEKFIADAVFAKSSAVKSGINPLYIYKMGYFREKLDLKLRNQPEDLMHFKAMIRYINEDENTLAAEFAEYEKNI